MQQILALSWGDVSGNIAHRGFGMPVGRNWRAEVCSRICAFGVFLVLVLALGMRAQDAKCAGTASDRAAPPAAATPTSSAGDSSTASPAPTPKKPKHEDDTTTPASPVPAAVQPKPTLNDFAWLAGRWQGAWGPRVAQQVWMPPKGGVMSGTFQEVENDTTLVIELFTLVQKPDGIKLYFRHFTPTLAPWETSTPTVLNLASSTPKAIEFDNPVDGEPKRAIIRRIDADTYVSRSEIVPEKGDTQIIEITYHRQKAIAPAKH
jgi:Domain of unknown function (DUF6265)